MTATVSRTVGRVTVECTVGDIAAQDDVEAVVNAANAELRTGGGVAGALHRAAGPGLAEEGRPLAPIEPGEAVVTGGHGLPNRYVIHCLGPVYGRDEPADELLASCYEEALSRAEEGEFTSVAFPAISTGAFGYPLEEAARIAATTVVDRAPELSSVRRIRFVLFDQRAFEAHVRALDDALEGVGHGSGGGTSTAALLLVDIQPDFVPGGALPVEGGDRIIEPVARLMDEGDFPLQVATQDWHPPNHVSFASRHSGHEPTDVIELYGHDQTLWPDHCIQGTAGAELHPGLPWERVEVVIRKGTDPESDSYSGFRNNWNPGGKRPPTGLAGYLRERSVEAVYLCGLARDVCVRWTAEDAVDEGFETHVIWDLTRSVDPSGDDRLRGALEELGVRIVDSDDLPLGRS